VVRIAVRRAGLVLAVEHGTVIVIVIVISKLQYAPKFADNQGVTDADIGMFVYVYMLSFLPQVLCTVWCMFKLYSHNGIC
jgi:hypothetical protein